MRHFLFAFLALVCQGWSSQTPCEWFDFNGDNLITANSWLYVASNYGVEGDGPDVDGSGIFDLPDLLSYVPYQGAGCPEVWLPETSGHVLAVGLVEHKVHNEPLAGLAGELPMGAVTYRMYAILSEPTDRVLAVYGDEERPMVLETAGEFYGFGSSSSFETVSISNYQPLLDAVFPANAYSTWLSAGLDEVLYGGGNTLTFIPPTSTWADDQQTGSIVLDEALGGAFCGHSPQYWPDHEGQMLIGQFTVTDPSDFHGVVNLLVMVDNGEAIEFAEAWAFDNSALLVEGCTDEQAYNFDPNAAMAEPESCAYPGDYNGDGTYAIDDLLQMLSQFGCSGCPSGDMDIDGIVGVGDILAFLTLMQL